MLHDRRLIGGDKEFAVANAQDDRRTVAGCHQRSGLILADHRNAIGAIDVAQGCGHCFLEIAFVERADQVRQHFGVGFRLEHRASGKQCLPQVGCVLDDAVVNQRDPSRHVGMRVRVGRGRRTMRGPPGVPNTEVPLRCLVFTEFTGQHAELAGSLSHRESTAVDNGNTRGVVAAVFHAPESFHQDRGRFPRSYVSHNATHPPPAFSL